MLAEVSINNSPVVYPVEVLTCGIWLVLCLH